MTINTTPAIWTIAMIDGRWSGVPWPYLSWPDPDVTYSERQVMGDLAISCFNKTLHYFNPLLSFLYIEFCYGVHPISRRMSITYNIWGTMRSGTVITPAPCFAGHMGFDMTFYSPDVDLMLHLKRLKPEADILSAQTGNGGKLTGDVVFFKVGPITPMRASCSGYLALGSTRKKGIKFLLVRGL